MKVRFGRIEATSAGVRRVLERRAAEAKAADEMRSPESVQLAATRDAIAKAQAELASLRAKGAGGESVEAIDRLVAIELRAVKNPTAAQKRAAEARVWKANAALYGDYVREQNARVEAQLSR
jgi:hypothetical protein